MRGSGSLQRLLALKQAFDKWAAEASEAAPAHWLEAEGSVHVLVGEIGSRADIIVAARPADNDRPARQAFRAALFGTDRPVLMVPPGQVAAFGRVVAVAWRDEKHAVRAVIPALRSLRAAEQVHLLVGLRAGAERPATPKILLEHGIRADLHVLPIGSGPFGQTLLTRDSPVVGRPARDGSLRPQPVARTDPRWCYTPHTDSRRHSRLYAPLIAAGYNKAVSVALHESGGGSTLPRFTMGMGFPIAALVEG